MSLLYLTFNSLRDAMLIFTGLFFATNGGVFGLWLRDMPFTISAGVGFIALNGASMLMGLVLINAIHHRMRLGMPRAEAIRDAALERLRPVLMTGTVAALGFLPMALSTGFGAEVQRPLATVVVFGMATATILTMISLPVLYLLFGRGPDPDPQVIAEAEAEGPPPAPSSAH
jgi:cobalt-zinc-cadmium resistance protein CzcA